MTHLEILQTLVYSEYVKNGYLHMWNSTIPNNIGDVAELGLICTEVSETIEIIRNKEFLNLEKLNEECADIIIRTLNFMSRKGLNAATAICDKHNINMNRKILHGRDV